MSFDDPPVVRLPAVPAVSEEHPTYWSSPALAVPPNIDLQAWEFIDPADVGGLDVNREHAWPFAFSWACNFAVTGGVIHWENLSRPAGSLTFKMAKRDVSICSVAVFTHVGAEGELTQAGDVMIFPEGYQPYWPS